VERHLQSSAGAFGLEVAKVQTAARTLWELELAFRQIDMPAHDQLRVLHVPGAAFVLDAAGRAVHANAVGRHRLEVQGDTMRAALAQAAREQDAVPDIVTTKLSVPGLPALHLAICATHDDRVRAGIERARTRWQLTAREAEVLAELAAGRQNRHIAEALGAAPRTIELHVSSLLRKAHCDSRSQLIIDLWHLADAA
jgi:DNA-binding CsgD family transcriptional regulator